MGLAAPIKASAVLGKNERSLNISNNTLKEKKIISANVGKGAKKGK